MKLSVTMQEALKAIARSGGYAVSEGNGYWKSWEGERLKVPEREDSVVTSVGTRTIYSLEDRGLLRRAFAPGKPFHRDTRIVTLEGEKICNELIKQ